MKELIAALSLTVVSTMSVPSISLAQSGDPSGNERSRDEIHAAVEACMKDAGATGGPREWNETVHAKVDACLKEKGIEKPPRPPGGRGPGGHHGPDVEKIKACLAEKGITLPEPTPGQRPELDEATRNAIDACREEVES